ncbi:MAG: hypothetical protein A3A73_00545 [Omnitrophica bacterium RIFCSPLOWO2_01_FULL_50_24]|nr:MAG: hypothetical protein A3A73_00545 [Omnitrophica bacterium RIFCSPLOWO2_01_FULL_50_24]
MLETLYLTKSKIRRKLLGFLFSNPRKEFYLSELARLVETSPGNIQREISRFVQDELIQVKKKGNLNFYVLNPRHALYAEIKSLVLKTSGIEAGLRDLVAKHKEISFAALYGSFARNEEHGESDIDLLIVSDKKLEAFYSAISKLELKFNREINPTAYSPLEFRKKIDTQDSFVTNVLKEPHRILKGSLSEFEKRITRKS